MPQLETKVFSIPGSEDEPIRGDVHAPVVEGKYPVLILAHGFKGFKDWGFCPYLAESLAAKGFVTVRFNFSHCGVEEDFLNFTNLEKFKKNRFGYELFDLNQVISATLRGSLPFCEKMDTSFVGLLGHSRGGYAVISAAEERHEVAKVATLAAISELTQITPVQASMWKAAGVFHVENARTGQQMPLGVELLEELLIGGSWIEERARNLNKPYLICLLYTSDAADEN